MHGREEHGKNQAGFPALARVTAGVWPVLTALLMPRDRVVALRGQAPLILRSFQTQKLSKTQQLACKEVPVPRLEISQRGCGGPEGDSDRRVTGLYVWRRLLNLRFQSQTVYSFSGLYGPCRAHARLSGLPDADPEQRLPREAARLRVWVISSQSTRQIQRQQET